QERGGGTERAPSRSGLPVPTRGCRHRPNLVRPGAVRGRGKYHSYVAGYAAWDENLSTAEAGGARGAPGRQAGTLAYVAPHDRQAKVSASSTVTGAGRRAGAGRRQ